MLLATSLAGAVFGLAHRDLSRSTCGRRLTNVASIVAHHGREGLTPHPELSLANTRTLRLPFALADCGGLRRRPVGKLTVKKHPLVNALLLALLISSACTYVLSRRQPGRPQAQWVPDKQYAAPSKALQAGEALKPENMELVSWPASDPLPGATARPAQLVGRIVLFPLDKGQPILERDLAAPGSVAGLSSKIPDGQRAIALKSDEVVGVGGFLIPGSRVDVLVSYKTDRLPEPITATVVQDAVVLAAGQQVEPDPAGKPTAVTVVTLLLTPQESERAFLASNQGAIHFVLRNAADRGRAEVEPVSLSQLSSGTIGLSATPAAIKSAAQGALPRPVKEMEIETVLGDGKSSARPDGGN